MELILYFRNKWSACRNVGAFIIQKQEWSYVKIWYKLKMRILGRSMIENRDRFVIVTTQDNASVVPIHERMPLILEKNELENRVYEDGYADFVSNPLPSF